MAVHGDNEFDPDDKKNNKTSNNAYKSQRIRGGTGISSIFIPKTQLRPNCQQSITKVAMAQLRCNADRLEFFHIIDTII